MTRISLPLTPILARAGLSVAAMAAMSDADVRAAAETVQALAELRGDAPAPKPVAKFSEQFSDTHPEVVKVVRFAEQHEAAIRKNRGDPAALVKTARLLAHTDPNFKATRLIGTAA